MKNHIILVSFLFLNGCISGAPNLTSEQQANLSKIKIHRAGNDPIYEYTTLSDISSADCSGPGITRLYGDEGKAIDILLAKAASINANAIIKVSCGIAPLVNNCWAAKKCNGLAIIRNE